MKTYAALKPPKTLLIIHVCNIHVKHFYYFRTSCKFGKPDCPYIQHNSH